MEVVKFNKYILLLILFSKVNFFEMEVGILAGDILSQSEIDALLVALSTGEMSADDMKNEEETRKVKVYDFKRALRFSKDQIRSLTRIHENFARLLTTFFSAQLRTYVQIISRFSRSNSF